MPGKVPYIYVQGGYFEVPQTTDILDQCYLGGGTPGATTYLRGDGNWVNPKQIKTISSNISNTTVSFTGSGLNLPVDSGYIYEIDAFITFQTAATTTGINLRLSSPTSSINSVEIVTPITSTAAATQLRTIFPNAAIANNASALLSTGVTATSSNHTAKISGFVRVNSAGSISIDFASEVANSGVTIMSSSILVIEKIGTV
jgi:hypothetical protein